MSARYQRAANAAERKVSQQKPPTTETANTTSRRTSSAPLGKAFAQAALSGDQTALDSALQVSQAITEGNGGETDIKSYERNTPRKRTMPSGTGVQAGTLKGLRDRVGKGSFHGRTGGVLGYDGTR